MVHFSKKDRVPGRYRRLLRYARPYWRGWLLIAALSLVAGGVALAQPWPIKIVVDHVLGQQSPSGPLGWLVGVLPGASSYTGLLAWAAVGSIVLVLMAGLVEAAMAIGWLRVGQRAVYDLARDLFARLQRRSVAFHNNASVGDLMGRITTDSICVYRLVETLLLGPFKAILLAGTMTLIMAQMNWPLTLVALLAAPLMGIATVALGRKVRRASRAKREIESRIQSHVQQTLSGMQVVQAFGQENREYDRFHHFAVAAIRAHRRNVFLANVTNLWTGTVVAVGTGVILLMGSRLVIEERLTIGELLVFLAYLAILQGHFQTLARTYTSIQALRGEIDRVTEILDSGPEVQEMPGARSLPQVQGHVRLENVTFGYLPGRPVLRNVSVEAQPGETIAIVGETGAGKTTLVSLIPRFFDPEEGCVLLDGHDVRELQLADVRRHVGIVLQEPYLMPGTIRDNITYGRRDATFDQIEAAARAANAHEFIEALPDQYNTVIGERGMTLSGGQRQRISIARALLKNAPILIMDEPTSALDAQTEMLLVEALQRLMHGRTTFIIAHRLSTIRHADCIVVLDAGRVVEQGKQHELLAQDGKYARMHFLQAGPTLGAAETEA